MSFINSMVGSALSSIKETEEDTNTKSNQFKSLASVETNTNESSSQKNIPVVFEKHMIMQQVLEEVLEVVSLKKRSFSPENPEGDLSFDLLFEGDEI